MTFEGSKVPYLCCHHGGVSFIIRLKHGVQAGEVVILSVRCCVLDIECMLQQCFYCLMNLSSYCFSCSSWDFNAFVQRVDLGKPPLCVFYFALYVHMHVCLHINICVCVWLSVCVCVCGGGGWWGGGGMCMHVCVFECACVQTDTAQRTENKLFMHLFISL